MIFTHRSIYCFNYSENSINPKRIADGFSTHTEFGSVTAYKKKTPLDYELGKISLPTLNFSVDSSWHNMSVVDK